MLAGYSCFFDLTCIQLAVNCNRRGGAVNNHPGNRRFRQFIQEFKHQYLNETKQKKPFVAMRVIDAVKNANPPGR